MLAAADTHVELLDGRQIVLRPIRGADKPLEQDLFDHLGPESRYRRFMGPHEQLTEREMRYFTEVDHHLHEAILALDAATGRCVGVGRYIATEDAPTVAELALTVVDDWQGAGVGTALLDCLVARAKEEGVERFTASVLTENTPMLALLADLGATHPADQWCGTAEYEVELAPALGR